MAYPNYPYPSCQPGYYPQQPVPDQLAQLRQQQMAQQIMQQPVQMMAPSPPMGQPVDDRIWVQGESAATAYLVAANGFVRLWDSTAPVYYEKRADAQGKPLPMEIFDYTRRGGEPETKAAPPPQIDMSQYIKRDELDGFREELERLWDKLETVQDRLKRPAKTIKTKEDADDA